MIKNLCKRLDSVCTISSVQVYLNHGVSYTPDFTKNNYRVQRGMFHTLEENHINFFRKLLGENRIVMDLSDLEKYNVDWQQHLRGNSKIVLKPETTEEVSKILQYCNENRLAVCPQGGNTGLVGGGVPVLDEIIISSSLMNNIISIDDTSGVLVCQAGCILQNLDEELSKKDLMMPLDLGAKGSCHIGGNLATNAGGLRLFRYGNLQGNVLGLEVVKASGEILNALSTLKKDNTGYHLKHLFIGSEGTLGFITKVAIQCPTRPKSRNLAFLGLQSYQKVLKTYKHAKSELGEILSALELMDAATMEIIKDLLDLDSPIGEYPFYLLIETSGSNEEHDTEKLHTFLEHSLVKNFILNGTVLTEPSKINDVWSIRERAGETLNTKEYYVFSYDFTFPLENYYVLTEEVREYMGDKAEKVYGFGHLGDGNIHLQIAVKEYSEEIKNYIESHLFKRVTELNGSISAEHGIGFLKAKYLPAVKSKSSLELMRNFKRFMDPNGILNPYKTIYLDE